ncbi:MAG: hypothetical protein WDW38_001735 [Sanguina aurantia]
MRERWGMGSASARHAGGGGGPQLLDWSSKPLIVRPPSVPSSIGPHNFGPYNFGPHSINPHSRGISDSRLSAISDPTPHQTPACNKVCGNVCFGARLSCHSPMHFAPSTIVTHHRGFYATRAAVK